MIVRRQFLVGFAASSICAPAVVRASSLMPVRSFALSFEPPYVPGQHRRGFIERLYVHTHISRIKRLRDGGLSSPTAIADAMNRKGPRRINGLLWDAPSVEGLIRWDRHIRLDDAFLRAERQKAGEW
jgi:hypothetical protein